MDRLQTLEICVRVAEAGSFTRAADLLQLPRSPVSAAVQTLENRMRTRLIHRTTRKMQLTADGSAYLAWCISSHGIGRQYAPRFILQRLFTNLFAT